MNDHIFNFWRDLIGLVFVGAIAVGVAFSVLGMIGVLIAMVITGGA